MPKKKKSKAKIIEEAAVILQKYVRLVAADENGYVECVTCGAVKPWQEMQGGHFISRACLATKLMIENVHPQCPGCNGPKGGNIPRYTLYMIDMYGREFVEELIALKNTTTHYTKAEAYEKLEEVKELMKGLEER
jgi:hypothetical protein